MNKQMQRIPAQTLSSFIRRLYEEAGMSPEDAAYSNLNAVAEHK